MVLEYLPDADDVKNTPSRLDGVPEDLETDLRIWGCFFIQDTGILLELPQVKYSERLWLNHLIFICHFGNF